MDISEFTLLYVEDDISTSNMLAPILQTIVSKVYIARNGKEGLEVYHEKKPDIILTDIRMPEMDGLQMTEIIREENQDIPIIVSSAHNETNLLLDAIKLKITNYTIKPVDLDLLESVLNDIIKQLEIKKENKLLQEKIKKQNEFISMALNNQPTMIVILDENKEISFVNKTLLDFFAVRGLEQFQEIYGSILNTFINNDIYFNKNKISKDEHWIDALKKVDIVDRIVSILSHQTMQVKAFKISIAEFENQHILTFTDISETILRKIQLEDKTLHDKLTASFNREYFDQNYNQIKNRYFNEAYNFGIAMLDIDYFKRINDNFGHDVGDEVLIHFVKTIKKYSREYDYVIRWGGEEFLLISKIRNYVDLEKTLENLRIKIENENFPTIGNLTCSMGGTIYEDDEDINLTIKRADQALYESKANGRNQITIVS